MNYKKHKNDWTIIIDDFDIKTSTQDDVNRIAKLIATNTCVVIKNQSLSVRDEIRFLKMFKDPEPLVSPEDPVFHSWAADLDQDPTGILCRVTAEERDGEEGMAGWYDEFDWHCNSPQQPHRRPIVYLYGVRGTAGSRTSWNNNILAYNDLDETIKDKIKDLHCIYGNISAPECINHTGVEYNTEWTPSLIHTNLSGQTCLYFAPMQLGKFVELSQNESDELKEFLQDHVLSEKYVYHHDWEDGDIVISDQWSGIHKRWPFDHMDRRLLHRGMVDYPEQNYKNWSLND